MIKKSDHNGRGQAHITETPDVSHIQNPDVTHEPSDVNVGGIAKFIVALFIGAIVIFALVWGMFRYFQNRELASETPASPLARAGEERLPPESVPRLQGSKGHSVNGQSTELKEPTAEMEIVRKEWRERLTSYGTAPDTGAVHIPIEQAKRLLLERGLPTRSSPGDTQEKLRGRDVPSLSSSGQQTEKREQ